MSNAFLEFTTAAGIERQHTVQNRPQQNGVAERANRTISEALTAMLAESGLPASFWGEALAYYVHVGNRLPTSAIPGATTPYELWHGAKPDVSHLRVWGCTAYVHVQRDKRNSLGPHMQMCIFIGYPTGYKGWKFWDNASKHTIISERADFDERYLPARKDAPLAPLPSLATPASPEPVPAPGGRVIDVELDTDSTPPHPVDPIIPVPPVTPVPPITPPPVVKRSRSASTSSSSSNSSSGSSSASPTPAQLSPAVPSVLTPPVRRSARQRRAPGEWWRVHRVENSPGTSEDSRTKK